MAGDNGHIREVLSSLDSKFVEEIDSSIDIVEDDPAGAATLTVSVEGTGVILWEGGPNRKHIVWVKAGRCADAAVLVSNGEAFRLLLVELKKSVTHTSWARAKRQFRAMLIYARALNGIFDMAPFIEVRCCVAYRNDDISPHLSASPTLLKTPVGGEDRFAGGGDWIADKVELNKGLEAEVVKVRLDDRGKAALRLGS